MEQLVIAARARGPSTRENTMSLGMKQGSEEKNSAPFGFKDGRSEHNHTRALAGCVT